MLPFVQRLLFLAFAAISGGFGIWGFYRMYRRIARGRVDTDARTNRLVKRIGYALATTLTQNRTFRKRPVVSFFHSFIFYGFTFYLLVNLVDAVEGFVRLPIESLGLLGHLYVLAADVLSALVLVGVVALVVRRFLLPSRRAFSFNERTVLHPDVRARYITLDSIIVSGFILFHVGSRAVGSGARLMLDGSDNFAPFATLLSHLFTPQNARGGEIFGYWGALGSVLAFLAYFPYSKHVHIFMAPLKYVVARDVSSGVLPTVELDLEAEVPGLGAARLEDLAWPRLIDAYACIQCNRCQDVCPAPATGKALSPSALEINKRMELNHLGKHFPLFENGEASPNNLLTFALSPEAAWACTTCGACLDVCPVQDEPMLDIIDIRRQQVMIEGKFPAQLQTAFRGMERSQNPWGINHEKRMDWAEGLNVRTTDENPEPDVLFWVGCAASYDPQSQKTARAFVQLLTHAEVDFAVLGKRECCTGDTARRAGNELLYRQLADKNVETLNEIKPKLIVATCPHCMNSIGKEYKQIGGDYKVMHHTEYLETLVASGKLDAASGSSTITYHDPCYLGRHNSVYDAPRNVLKILSNDLVELPRNRENAFCCGAGGAQFWKEEEPGDQRISDNRFREVQERLGGGEDKVLAVGCPFCKSMLESTPSRASDPIAIKDVAELLLEGLQRKHPTASIFQDKIARTGSSEHTLSSAPVPGASLTERVATIGLASSSAIVVEAEALPDQPTRIATPEPDVKPPTRKAWTPRRNTEATDSVTANEPTEVPLVVEILATQPSSQSEDARDASVEAATTPARKVWTPKRNRGIDTSAIVETSKLIATNDQHSTEQEAKVADSAVEPKLLVARKVWAPKKKGDT